MRVRVKFCGDMMAYSSKCGEKCEVFFVGLLDEHIIRNVQYETLFSIIDGRPCFICMTQMAVCPPICE